MGGAQKNEHMLIGQQVNVDINLPPLQSYEKLVRLHVPEEATPSFKMSLITMKYNIQITIKTFDKMLSHVVFYAVATVGNLKENEEKKNNEQPKMKDLKPDSEGPPPFYDSLFEQPGASGSGIGVAQ